MDEMRIKVGGEERVFLPNGDVAVAQGTNLVTKGKWRAAAKGNEAKKNLFRYTIDDAAQPPVPIKYSFNEHNQAVATGIGVGANGANTEPFVLRGQIEIDDKHDLIYRIFNKDGTSSGNSLTVYGTLGFAADTNNLTIALEGGAEAEIKGASGVESVQALANSIAEIEADDLLNFFALTRNDLSTSPTRVPAKAKIKFFGKWDLQENNGENQLVFFSQVTGGSTDKSVTIGFGGKVKAVTAGFAYFADKNGQNLSFKIEGQHKWNSKEAKWSLSLGHTQKIFKAGFSGEFKKNLPDGQFFLSGNLDIELAANKKAKMNLEVGGTYEFKNNKLVFKALVDINNGVLNYDLQIEGTFTFKSGVLSFKVRNSKNFSDSKIELQVAFKGNNDNLRTMLALVLDKNKNEIKLTFEFELRMRFKDGVLIKEPPKPLPA